MLRVLFATVGNDFHLGDIEEFRRLKGFGGELDEVEETLKEKIASLEVFALCHDLGKLETIRFEARENSAGASLGFRDDLSHAWQKGREDRKSLTERYNKEYKKFATSMVGALEQEIQDAFFSAYQISIFYPGYTHQIARPELREVFNKESKKRRLTMEDAEDVFHAILLHEKIIHDFSVSPNFSTYNHLIAYSIKYGRDPDDFLDFLLAAIFLEIASRPRRGVRGTFFDLTPFINFLITEHESVPGKRNERARLRRERQLKAERAALRAAGLDGNDLMKILGMKPCPEFGQVLAAIHAWAKNETPMPNVPIRARDELTKRVQKFRSQNP
jgi:hypothetical protein